MKNVHPPQKFISASLVVLGCALFLGMAPRMFAPVAVALPSVETPIPKGPSPQKSYKTWSLFLVTNQEWLLAQSDGKLDSLYEQFKAFGDSIGDDNLAVWFWSKERVPGESRKAIDVRRNIEFCRHLDLKPSEGPYVLVTTEYPGESLLDDPNSFPKDKTNMLVIKLDGSDATVTARLLGGLVDQIIAEKLNSRQVKTEDYWAGWRAIFVKISGAVIGLSSKVTVSYEVGPVKTEINLGK